MASTNTKVFCCVFFFKYLDAFNSIQICLIFSSNPLGEHIYIIKVSNCFFIIIWINGILCLGHLFVSFRDLEQHDRIQSFCRDDWVWRTRDHVTNLLEHKLLQDLPWYENRPTNQLHSTWKGGGISILIDRWWTISQHLIGSQYLEEVGWFRDLVAALLQQGGVQCIHVF